MARKCQESNFKTCDWSGDDLDQAILENKIPGLGSGNDYADSTLKCIKVNHLAAAI
jgi:hypothetical protein